MIISWNWLKRYSELGGLDPKSVAQRFTLTTAEIEEVIEAPDTSFVAQFKVAKVEEVIPHPNADKLRCCKVNDGETILDIVCGAPNVRPGLLTVLAPIGADLGGGFKIKKSKLRGEPSEGMLCSETELKIGDDDDGIIELSSGTPGQTADQVVTMMGPRWDLDNKAITHRPDLWGHYGISRELSSVYQVPLNNLDLPELPETGPECSIKVDIKNPEVCRRYCGLQVDNITVQPSPAWLQILLKEVGLKPINNVVDATNFVMFELGQPTHAFDLKQLDQNISVEFAKAGEKFNALIGKELELRDDSLVIRSGEKAVALAGVVGGENSSIQDDTTSIFIEAAHFAPLCVRKTAQIFDCRTDSSSRFEKSLDPVHAKMAVQRIISLLKETCPDLALPTSFIDVYPEPIQDLIIKLDPELVNKKLGITLANDKQKAILERLNFEILSENSGIWEVKVPSFRNTKDIEGSMDLVEEIGRIHGYDAIIPQSPVLELESLPETETQSKIRCLQDFLTHRGYSEIMTYSFTSLEEHEKLSMSTSDLMAIKNPINREQTHMRSNLLPRQIDAWVNNAKQLDQFQLFEFGTIFKKSDSLLPVEKEQLCMAIYGDGDQGEHLFQIKQDLLDLCDQLKTAPIQVRQLDQPQDLAHPKRTGHLYQGNDLVGYLAELHPSIAQKFGIKKRLSFALIFAPLDLEKLNNIKYQGLDKFPPVPFAISLLAPERTTVGEVLELIQNCDHDLIRELKWDGNYTGDSIPEGKVSMTFSMNFRRFDRTMKSDEIKELQDKVIDHANEKGYFLREG